MSATVRFTTQSDISTSVAHITGWAWTSQHFVTFQQIFAKKFTDLVLPFTSSLKYLCFGFCRWGPLIIGRCNSITIELYNINFPFCLSICGRSSSVHDAFGTKGRRFRYRSSGPLRYIDKHMPWTSPLRYIFQYDFGTYEFILASTWWITGFPSAYRSNLRVRALYQDTQTDFTKFSYI